MIVCTWPGPSAAFVVLLWHGTDPDQHDSGRGPAGEGAPCAPRLPDSALVDEALAALSRERAAEIDTAYAAYGEHPLDERDVWGDLASFRDASGAS